MEPSHQESTTNLLYQDGTASGPPITASRTPGSGSSKRGLMATLINGFEHGSSWIQRSKFWKPHYFVYLHYWTTLSLHFDSLLLARSFWDERIWTLDLVIFVATLILYEVTRNSDPGYIPKLAPGTLKQTHSTLPICETCNNWKFLRSKHCRRCDKCVYRFDHHCPWTFTCIGANNHRWYYSFVLLQVIDLVFLVSSHVLLVMNSSSIAVIFYGFQLIYGIALFVGTVGLLAGHTMKMTKNITSNEVINEKRFAYLSLKPYNNPFDMGREQNIKQFFSGFKTEQPRWGAPIQVKLVLPDDVELGVSTRVNDS